MELEQVYQTPEDVKAEKNQSQLSGRSQELEESGWEEFTEGLTDVHLAAVVGGKFTHFQKGCHSCGSDGD